MVSVPNIAVEVLLERQQTHMISSKIGFLKGMPIIPRATIVEHIQERVRDIICEMERSLFLSHAVVKVPIILL